MSIRAEDLTPVNKFRGPGRAGPDRAGRATRRLVRLGEAGLEPLAEGVAASVHPVLRGVADGVSYADSG